MAPWRCGGACTEHHTPPSACRPNPQLASHAPRLADPLQNYSATTLHIALSCNGTSLRNDLIT